ncbi:MAG: methyltransferase domain-containing protein [Verrucomicrobiia bacterium]
MDWEQRYEVHDTPWEKGYAAPPLQDYLESHKIEGEVLVPGCGLGHDARLLAGQGAEVTGLDIAPTAIERAKEFPGKVEYVLGDLFCLPEAWKEKFDWVVEHTCFCAIDPNQREAYVKSVYEVLKINGKLFGIFYLNPEVEEGPPFGVKTTQLDLLFNPYFNLEKEWFPNRSYEGREGKELLRIYQKK